MTGNKLPPPCLSQVLGKYTSMCLCTWCTKRFQLELAEPDAVTIPYDPNLTVVLRVECER